MCGILGWSGKNINSDNACKSLDKLNHRGPDDYGIWSEDAIWMGHRRLSILDISSLGKQPYVSKCKNLIIVFNGEIYNYKELRQELQNQGINFVSNTDTEVLVESISFWGIKKSLSKFVGMFAFALYNRYKKELTLVRDRLGVKPLHYCIIGNDLIFSSEIKPLIEINFISKEINKNALCDYFRHLVIHSPETIYSRIKKLEPGAILTWHEGKSNKSKYWNIKDISYNGLTNQLHKDEGDYLNEVENLLIESVKLRLISDVPIGVFLSGGIDSSLVTAIAQKVSTSNISTFSIGFSDSEYDESTDAKIISNILGTEHNEKVLNSIDVFNQIPKIAAEQDEPFADSSLIPTIILSKFARNNVKVALSGDGGDEFFAGYPRYFWANKIQNIQKYLTPIGSKFLGNILKLFPDKFWNVFISYLTNYKFSGSNGMAQRVNRFSEYLRVKPEKFYEEMCPGWNNLNKLLDLDYKEISLGPSIIGHNHPNWAQAMMECDQQFFLIDDVLTKVDRSSMRVSLEAREPLLDHRIAEYSWQIPFQYHVNNDLDQGKRILRKILEKYIPKIHIDKPKKGFNMPVEKWLRSDLRDWAE